MTWDNILNDLDTKFHYLVNSDLINRIEIKNIKFDKGIYIFYENNKAIYVGRSNRIKKRLQEHGNAISTHYSASFAFILAKHEAKEMNILKHDIGKNKTRAELEKDVQFNPLFINQKKRVADMQFRVIGINDANFQAIFEIYASMKLDTLHNTFDNH